MIAIGNEIGQVLKRNPKLQTALRDAQERTLIGTRLLLWKFKYKGRIYYRLADKASPFWTRRDILTDNKEEILVRLL